MNTRKVENQIKITPELQELFDISGKNQKDYLWEIGSAIRRKRKELTLSQDALAFDTGTSRTSIVNIESGRNIDFRYLFRILTHLEIDIAVKLF